MYGIPLMSMALSVFKCCHSIPDLGVVEFCLIDTLGALAYGASFQTVSLTQAAS